LCGCPELRLRQFLRLQSMLQTALLQATLLPQPVPSLLQ
jgi:hypothetical protein